MQKNHERECTFQNPVGMKVDRLRKRNRNITTTAFSKMSAVLILSALTFGSLLISCQNSNNQDNKKEVMQNNQEQKDGILKAIELYVEAGRKGDGNIAKPAFASTATMSWSEDGKLKSVPIQALYDGFSAAKPMEAGYKLTTLDVEGDAAIVRIESQFGPDKYADMFTLVKDGSNWKIISKIYQVIK